MLRFAQSFQRNFSTIIHCGALEKQPKKTFSCWPATTQRDLMLGLMGCNLQPRQGCLLVYDEPLQIQLWMKNCLHPLTAVFADKNGQVIGFAHMDHRNPNVLHHSPDNTQYALELLPEDASGIEVGDYLWGESDASTH